MVGTLTTKEKLNCTLETVCNILRKNNIDDWFIFFGTLLGIVREDSCIEDDDDLDFMINHDYQKLRSVFEAEGFTFTSEHGIKDSDKILKSKPCDKYASFDFYMCNVNESGDFHSPWQGVTSTKSYWNLASKTFITKEWRSTVLNIPKDPKKKLDNMYGDWKTPSGKSCGAMIGRV